MLPLRLGKIVNKGFWVFVKDFVFFFESADGQAETRETWNSGYVM